MSRTHVEILNPSMRWYRDQLYSGISRVVVRHSMLTKDDKCHVVRMILHHINEGKL